MHIIWQKNEKGHIALDLGAVRSFVSSKLGKNEEVINLYFDSGKSSIACVLQLPKPERLDALRGLLCPIFETTGIALSLEAVEVVRFQDQLAFYESPLFWGLLFGMIYIFGKLGLGGIVACAVYSVIGYALSWLFLTQKGKDYTEQIAKKMQNTINGFKN